MLEILEVASDLVEAVAESFHWRDDWNRTLSPVSFFLALFSAGALLLLVLFCILGALTRILG